MEALATRLAHNPPALAALLAVIAGMFLLLRTSRAHAEERARAERAAQKRRRQRTASSGSPMRPLVHREPAGDPVYLRDGHTDPDHLDTGELTAIWTAGPEEGEDDGEGPTPVGEPDPAEQLEQLLEHIDSLDEARAHVEHLRKIDAERMAELEERLAVAYVDDMLLELQHHGQPMSAYELAAAAQCDVESAEFSRRTMSALVFGVLRTYHDEDAGTHRLATIRYYLEGMLDGTEEAEQLETVRLSRAEGRQLAEVLAPEMFSGPTDHRHESWPAEIETAMANRSVLG